jgi:hypothetical protein
MPWQWPGQRCASRLVRRLVAGEAFKLSALAQELDEELAFDNAQEVCRAAAEPGIRVTLDMEDHTTTDSANLRRG